MTKAEIEAALQIAYAQCESAGYPLNDSQRQILRQVILAQLLGESGTERREPSSASNPGAENPLDEMAPADRQALLQFIRTQDLTTNAWKTRLLNDWLQGQASGELQFIRDVYGPQWLSRVQLAHLAQYLEPNEVPLTVGDRIEVSNGLWEWVQDNGPCPREWVACTVIGIRDISNDSNTLPPSYHRSTTCTVRFDNGREFEIQGIYEWNRYSWRWPATRKSKE